MSTATIILLIVLALAVTSALVFWLGYGIKRDAEHQSRFRRRDRARRGGRAGRDM